MKRREFLQTTAAATAGAALLGGLPIGAYGYSPELVALTNATTQSDKVLVIIQLQGGNDGLNMIIPLDQYSALMAARPTLALPQNDVLPLTTATGIHPAMAALHNLYQNGKMGVVQSVGYPSPNFSHFRATDIWTSGSDSNATINTGWAGRYLEGEYPGYPTGFPNTQNPDPLAISIGSVVSNCVQGPTVNMGMAIASTSSFYQLLSGGVDAAPNTPAGHELTFIRQVVSQTQVYTTTIQAAAARARNLSPLYPTAGQNSLADQLKIVAQLVAGGLQTRIYVCQLGGFDTHTLQVPATGSTTGGSHASLLGKIAEAVNAFQDDLRRLSVQDRVVGMTFSEFGRRIKANSGFGTDHGAAAPLLVFGSKVNPMVHGLNPTLPANAGVNDNVAMQFDFRSIYTSILKDWFQVTDATITQLFGRTFPYVPLLRPTPLPVELLSFAATFKQGTVALLWRTASEVQSDRFEVERSSDGQTFARIATLAAQGTKASPTTYNLLDENLPRGGAKTLYYRLRQVDIGGKEAYSPVATVHLPEATHNLTVYPNPVARNGQTTAVYESVGGYVQIVVLDTMGRQVRRVLDGVLASGPQFVPLDLSGLAAGTYYCQVREAQHTSSRTVTIE